MRMRMGERPVAVQVPGHLLICWGGLDPKSLRRRFAERAEPQRSWLLGLCRQYRDALNPVLGACVACASGDVGGRHDDHRDRRPATIDLGAGYERGHPFRRHLRPRGLDLRDGVGAARHLVAGKRGPAFRSRFEVVALVPAALEQPQVVGEANRGRLEVGDRRACAGRGIGGGPQRPAGSDRDHSLRIRVLIRRDAPPAGRQDSGSLALDISERHRPANAQTSNSMPAPLAPKRSARRTREALRRRQDLTHTSQGR